MYFGEQWFINSLQRLLWCIIYNKALFKDNMYILNGIKGRKMICKINRFCPPWTCKLMRPSERCLVTETARYFPANYVPAMLFQPIAFGKASFPSGLMFWNHCQSNSSWRKAWKFRLELGTSFYRIYLSFYSFNLSFSNSLSTVIYHNTQNIFRH